MTAYRIRIRCGSRSKRLLITEGVQPARGMVIEIDGVGWIVTSVRADKIVATFEVDGHTLRQKAPALPDYGTDAKAAGKAEYERVTKERE